MKKAIGMLTGKWGIFIFTTLVCTAAAFYFTASKPARAKPQKDHAPLGMPVTVEEIRPATYPAKVWALGEARPLWQSVVKARVDGAVVHLSPRLQPGVRVTKGELLVKIEAMAYEARISEDKDRVASARVTLLKEEREARQAQINWQGSAIKGAPASDLVLRAPQMASARAGLEAAQKALTLARTRLSYTRVCAPFDGIILERHINPGETLFTGDKIFTLFGVDAVEVGVHLSDAQMALLKNKEPGPAHTRSGQMAARLVSPLRGEAWQAKVMRDSQCLDTDSRLHTLFLQVDRPLAKTPPLLPGTFVRAEITGADLPGLLRLPETALTQQGAIWFVDAQSRLEPFYTRPVFYGRGVVYIRPPQKAKAPFRVAISPNETFTSGLLVRPQQKERG